MKRPTLADLGIAELRVWAHVSPSQINTFNTCQRRWWMERRTPSPRDESEAAQRGTLVHTILEIYALSGVMPNEDHIIGLLQRDEYSLIREKYLAAGSKWTYKTFAAMAKKCACAVAVHIRVQLPVSPLSVEHGFRIKTPGLAVPAIGFIDFLYPDRPRIVDYKVRSRRDYVVSEAKLRDDPQFLIYGALGAAMRASVPSQQKASFDGGIETLINSPVFEDGEFQHINVVWGSGETIPVTVKYTAAEAAAGWHRIEQFTHKMAAVAANDHPADVNPTVGEDSCFAYRKRCPFRDTCITLGDVEPSGAEQMRGVVVKDIDPQAMMSYISAGSTAAARPSGDNMPPSLADMLAARRANAGVTPGTTPAPTTPPAQAAPPPPPVEEPKVEAAPPPPPVEEPKVEAAPPPPPVEELKVEVVPALAEPVKESEAPPGVNGVGGVSMDDDNVSASAHNGKSAEKGVRLPDGRRLYSAEVTLEVAKAEHTTLVDLCNERQLAAAAAYLGRLVKPNCAVKGVPYTVTSNASKTGRKVQIEALLRALAGDDVDLLNRYGLDYYPPPEDGTDSAAVEAFESGDPADILKRICSKAKEGTTNQAIAEQLWDIVSRRLGYDLTDEQLAELYQVASEDDDLRAVIESARPTAGGEIAKAQLDLFADAAKVHDGGHGGNVVVDGIVEECDCCCQGTPVNVAAALTQMMSPLSAESISQAIVHMGKLGIESVRELITEILGLTLMTGPVLTAANLTTKQVLAACRAGLAQLELNAPLAVAMHDLCESLYAARVAAGRAASAVPAPPPQAKVEPKVEAKVAPTPEAPSKPAPEAAPEAPSDVEINFFLLVDCAPNVSNPNMQYLDQVLRALEMHIAEEFGVAYGCDQYNATGKRMGELVSRKLSEIVERKPAGAMFFLVSSKRTDYQYIRAAFAGRSDAIIIEG